MRRYNVIHPALVSQFGERGPPLPQLLFLGLPRHSSMRAKDRAAYAASVFDVRPAASLTTCSTTLRR
jgi:hypothetical protein